MSTSRREFLTLAGLAAVSFGPGCAVLSPSISGGWLEADLETLKRTAGLGGGKGWAAWQGGRIQATQSPDARGPSLSITKCIATLAASRAAKDGWLSAGEKVSMTLPEWRADPRKNAITVRMLLQQTSGLEAGVIPLYRNRPGDKGKAAVALRCTDTPGTVFRYGPSHWEVLAEVMRRKLATRGKSLPDFINTAVMSPIGLYSGNWRSDRGDIPYFSTGTELSVMELGRLGRTLGRLLSGRDSDGITATDFREMAQPSAVNPMFGGGVWRNSSAGRPGAHAIEVERSIDSPLPSSFWSRACLSTRQPQDFVALIGSGGRRVYIWPGSDRRIARVSSSSSWSDTAFLGRLAST